MDKSITHFEVRRLLYLIKEVRKLKSDGAITIHFKRLDCEEDEIAIGFHDDAGNITAKMGIIVGRK